MDKSDGDRVSDYLVHYSRELKKGGRTIVFAIIATIWSMSYNKGVFEPVRETKIALLLSIIYLFLDLLIYLILTVSYKYILTHKFISLKDQGFVYRSNKITITTQTRIIHEISFYWLLVMAIILLIASTYLIIYIWRLI